MRASIALLTCALLGACASSEEPESTARARQPIIGGAPEDGAPAVVMLASWSPDLNVLDICTATLVAPEVLLTAAHCVDPRTHPGWGFGVFFGSDASAYATASTLVPQLQPIGEVLIHPDYDPAPPFSADLALVELERPAPMAPLPLLWSPLDPELVGEAATIVGYGQTTYEVPNLRKHAAVTVLAEIDEGDTITVGDLERRTCIGDSGGPALMSIDGAITVVGVNSYTDLAGCLEPAHYRRTDLYGGFLAERLSPPAPAEGGGGAGAGGEASGGEASGGAAAGGDEADASGGCQAARAGATSRAGVLLALALGWLATRRRRALTSPAPSGPGTRAGCRRARRGVPPLAR